MENAERRDESGRWVDGGGGARETVESSFPAQ